MRKPYYVCGGLQDNGSWCGPSATRSQQRHPQLRLVPRRRRRRLLHRERSDRLDDPLFRVAGRRDQSRSICGRAGRVSIRPRGPRPRRPAAAAGAPKAPDPGGRSRSSAFGRGNPNGNIVPAPPPGTNFRFYWNTPFMLSPHNPSTIYLGGDRLFRSNDRGDTWMASPDLTRNIGRNDRPDHGRRRQGADGVEARRRRRRTATSSRSANRRSCRACIWVGTNDGNVQVSRDGGDTWKNVVDKVPGVPKETHVSRVEPSHFDAGTAYVTFDGHRTDDHKPYVFMTTDFGETWTSIAGNLPDGNVNVIREDPKNRNLLFLGTEYAFYVSLDGGKEWKRFMNGLPTVRIDDILVHPRDNDLIVGTHGRSIWIIDDITALQQMTRRDAERRRDAVRHPARRPRGSTTSRRRFSVERREGLPQRRTRRAARRSATG